MAKLQPKELVARHSRLKAAKAVWDTLFQELADYFIPNKNTILRSLTGGTKRNTHLLDGVGMQSANKLASFLQGALTNPNVQWFELTTGIPELDRDDEVRFWMQDTTTRMHNMLNASNFQTEVHEKYLDDVVFGTSTMFMEEDKDTDVRFSTKHIDGICIEEDYLGRVNGVYLEFKWNLRQIEEMFGAESLDAEMVKQSKEDGELKYPIVHGIYRNYEKQVGEPTAYYSQYVMKDKGKELSTEQTLKGFRFFPVLVSRWVKAPDEVYGRSPGMDALPDMKILNKMTEVQIIAAQKVADPPLQASDDGVVMPIRTYPGGITFVRPGSDPIKPIFNQIPVDFGYQSLAERRDRIRSSFMVDQLQTVQSDRMTAREFLGRREENSVLLGPVLVRQESEFLAPLVDRLFDIGLRKNRFLPIPQKLSGMKVPAKYTSIIAQSQRVGQAQNLLRAVEASAPFMQLDPDAIDLVDAEESIRTIFQAFGATQKAVRSQDEINGRREARDAAQQEAVEQAKAQSQAEQMNKVAPMMKVAAGQQQ